MSQDLRSNTPCVETTGRRHRQGYGVLWYEGKDRLEHRVAYCQHHGVTLDSIEGQVIRHKCDNPPCINPEHLLIGTHKQNTQDMVSRGRQANVKLTWDMVRYIRANYVHRSREFGQYPLAAMFGVSQSVVSEVIAHKIWKDNE
jgi:hypothetical protein